MRQVAASGVPLAARHATAPTSAALAMAGLICMALNSLFQAMRTASSSPGAPPEVGFLDDLDEALVSYCYLGSLQPLHSRADVCNAMP